jgi:hypothetical protein
MPKTFSDHGFKYQLIQVLNFGIGFWLRLRKVINKLKSFSLRVLLYVMKRSNLSPQWIINHLPPPKTVRRYISPEMGRDIFFDALNERKIQYVILRWFEDLPDWPPKEDMDILIHDDAFGKISDLFIRYPKIIPTDVYSVTANSGWNNLPYYPPHIAKLILRERVLWKNRYYIPCPEHHFLSLTYHVVFHKAENSGLPLFRDKENFNNDAGRVYIQTLTKLAEQIGIRFRPNLKDMYILLKDNGWLPPLGTFRKLAERSKFLTSLLTEKNQNNQDGELIVFTIREWAVRNNWLDFIMEWFEKKRNMFEVIKVKKLDERQQQLASREIRGGVWGQGPYPLSGGKPSVFIIAYDHNPAPVPNDKKKNFPFIKNGHFFLKNEIRDEINKRLLRTRWVNCVHSSDDEIEAWEDLKSICCPELIQEVHERIEKYRQNVQKWF